MINITQMKPGQKGEIIQVQGGYGLIRKLEAMGITIGTEILKASAQIMRGPVTIRVGNTQVAIGFGMARRIIVEIK